MFPMSPLTHLQSFWCISTDGSTHALWMAFPDAVSEGRCISECVLGATVTPMSPYLVHTCGESLCWSGVGMTNEECLFVSVDNQLVSTLGVPGSWGNSTFSHVPEFLKGREPKVWKLGETCRQNSSQLQHMRIIGYRSLCSTTVKNAHIFNPFRGGKERNSLDTLGQLN